MEDADGARHHGRRRSSNLPVDQLVLLRHNLASLTDLEQQQAFENTSTSVAASQMRNALNSLGDSVKDPAEKKVCVTTP